MKENLTLICCDVGQLHTISQILFLCPANLCLGLNIHCMLITWVHILASTDQVFAITAIDKPDNECNIMLPTY